MSKAMDEARRIALAKLTEGANILTADLSVMYIHCMLAGKHHLLLARVRSCFVFHTIELEAGMGMVAGRVKAEGAM
jgi:hypothetical protein